MNSISFCIIGGDKRYRIIADMLREEGHLVKTLLTLEDIRKAVGENGLNCLDSVVKGVDAVIVPIPCSKDRENIFMAEGTDICISYKRLFEAMRANSVRLLFGGVIHNEIRAMAEENNVAAFDFFEQEAVAVMNAIPTAEGAIQSAMAESECCLFASRALVLGYGRCGKILANMLKGIGAEVSVSYRNETAQAYIKAYGYKAVKLDNIAEVIGEYDFIFNTAPSMVFNKGLLELVNKRTVIIDIAQAPGGVDYSAARDLDLKALYCPGLPGRVAPYTAAKILKEAILNICLSQPL